jgi:peptidyl-prolyl cis-trans isomerase A (cyclophilin A)
MLALVVALALSPLQAPGTGPASPAGPFVALDVVEGTQPLGTITIELLPDKAPLSVANFLQYVREGHYDGTIFHRVMPNFMIQGGGLTPDMQEKPQRPPIRNEARNRLRNSRGTVAMARKDDPGSATSQFFINVRDNHNLDFGIAGAGYAVFGRVVAGMDVVDRIALVPTGRRGQYENVPSRPVVIAHAHEVEAPPTTPEVPAAPTAVPDASGAEPPAQP